MPPQQKEQSVPIQSSRFPLFVLTVAHGIAIGTLVLLASAVSAQPGALHGRVVDAATGEPLPGVSVFLSQTTRGAATDADGQFAFSGVTAGSYVLVASMVGYERAHWNVDVSGEPVQAAFRLRRAEASLGAVEVVADNRAWRRQLRRFERLFFGPTPRSRSCTILNPEVLDFADHGGAFTATASAPFVFENRALGYRVTYVIERFRAEGETVVFGGFPRYEDLPGAPDQRERWRDAREEAYRGSFQHFLRALARGTALDEGFDAYLLDDFRIPRWSEGGPAFVPRVPFDSLVTTVADGAHALAFERTLHVEYLRERRHRDAPQPFGGGAERHQRSALRLHAPAVRFHPLGYILDPFDVSGPNYTTYGYWSWEGHVGDLLPLDYVSGSPTP